ncbi:Putative PD-(D/E)XK family member [Lentzea waywayandensis]|uniref:Putative PD-(D/E)XK family member n=1 Tax=Lentzea waywayandensis TaxID=84724 RepID=A0A1I6E2I4_9PSEU|nr:PD-(D/E)XK motif protein [Lentzea waywayandensis]SFR11751.1 Putative PD-(D/E)XK family member [Lentzea waywayandensis]
MTTLTYADVRRVFDRLPLPEDTAGTSYATEQLVGQTIRLGKTHEGLPVLVIAEPSELRTALQDRHYANIRLRHQRVLRLVDGQEPSTYSVLECVTRDPAVQDWFLRLLPSLLERVGDKGADELNHQVAWLNELFRNFDSAAGKDMTGIWAELFLLHEAFDPVHAITAWRSDRDSRYDFTDDGSHVEVKATTHADRKHAFSASQLEPGDRVLVASLLLDRSDRGASVLDLYQQIAVRLAGASEAGEKLHRHVMAMVGTRVAEADDTRFDMQAAGENLRVYRAVDVPQVSAPFPVGVSNIRFTADLTDTATAAPRLGERSALWKELLAVGSSEE